MWLGHPLWSCILVSSTDALSAELASIDFDVTLQAGKLNFVIFVYRCIRKLEFAAVGLQISLNQWVSAANAGIYNHHFDSFLY